MSVEALLIAPALFAVVLALFLLVLRAARGRTAPARDVQADRDVRSERDAIIGEQVVVDAPGSGRFTREGAVPQREADKALAATGTRPRGGF